MSTLMCVCVHVCERERERREEKRREDICKEVICCVVFPVIDVSNERIYLSAECLKKQIRAALSYLAVSLHYCSWERTVHIYT